ncbi:hypothetical protein NS383_14135 [Pseudomonas oryzihabitans]|nr:hypothetical protein NS383_14135 [Pseudomonas psychrotolerans]
MYDTRGLALPDDLAAAGNSAFNLERGRSLAQSEVLTLTTLNRERYPKAEVLLAQGLFKVCCASAKRR